MVTLQLLWGSAYHRTAANPNNSYREWGVGVRVVLPIFSPPLLIHKNFISALFWVFFFPWNRFHEAAG